MTEPTSGSGPVTTEWLAGYEAAKAQAASAIEAAAQHSLDEVRKEVRLRCARVIRGMQPREVPMTETVPIPTDPRIHPDTIGAWRQGEASYPNGPEQAPDWWPWCKRRTYLDGRWHACWTTAEKERADAR